MKDLNKKDKRDGIWSERWKNWKTEERAEIVPVILYRGTVFKAKK